MLNSSLAIGRSGLTAAQFGIQVTGNNFANASTPGYSRQTVSLAGAPDQRWGAFAIGRGVQVTGINRSIDQALQGRIWNSLSQEQAAGAGQQFLNSVQSMVNELGNNSLTDEMTKFFGSWSELANSPNRDGARALVVQQGRTLASAIRTLRNDLFNTQSQLDGQIAAGYDQADNILRQIADINVNIVNSEGGSSSANALRDQRDQLVTQLAGIMDVTVVPQPSGAYDILVGSTPVVLAGESRGLRLDRTTSSTGASGIEIAVKADGTRLTITGGVLGGLLQQRGGTVEATINKLDTVTSQLIFQLNRIHSSGYSTAGMTSVTSTLSVPGSDVTRALNDPANATFSELPFKASNGGFLVTVKNMQTGASKTVRINVDLDGVTNAGTPGTANDSSVASIAANVDGLDNLSATVNTNGTISIAAENGYQVSFAEDTSGVLAVLGINTYFTGRNATDIAVRDALVASPNQLSTGRMVNGQPSDNGAALAIAGLRTEANNSLGGESILGAWRGAAQAIGAEAAAGASKATAASLVRENLEAQRAAISGVSMDEESINLLNFQRQYQGAARFISVVDEMTQTLLGLVGR